jgi:hypothetical protein
MSLATKLRRAPLRLSTGAYIMNSGVSKLGGDEQQAIGVHGMASSAYPFLKPIPPKVFLKCLGVGEVALGGLLLLPLVPTGIAGLALSAFGTGLLGLYVRTPGVHDENLRPQGAGVGLAKDVWLASIGYGLVVDAALTRRKPTKAVSEKADADDDPEADFTP